MRESVLHHYPNNEAARSFKASSGWQKRFMGRYGIVWRRRNDNAKKGVAELLVPVAAFINELRAFRRANPDDVDLVFGEFGEYNTFDVDQVPMPFASSDPRTLEFHGVERVWVKAPGSGLDKRQGTLQLVIRPLGRQPKPCLLFRGTPTAKMKRDYDRKNRETEEGLYDPDIDVLWQAKAWADTVTCIEWAEGPFKAFVDAELPEQESLLLADNLSSQTKLAFGDAVKTSCRAQLQFGPKGATYIWQPVDHHIGREYTRRMATKYDDWMAKEFEQYCNGHVTAGQRRVLMTKWAGEVYRELEAEREEFERKGERSRFYKAFLRTGCLVTADGSGDDQIKPHSSIVGDLADKFNSILEVGRQRAPLRPRESFIIELSASEYEDETSADDDGDEYNSEDQDDEPGEDSDDDDGQREPIPDSMELNFEQDEAEEIRAARSAIGQEREEEMRDFSMALRIARQDGYAVAPSFSGRNGEREYNGRRQELYDQRLAEFETERGRKATSSQIDRIWNEAARDACAAPAADPDPGDGRRRSSRSKRHRLH